MARAKKDEVINITTIESPAKNVTPNDIEWTDHVLSLLSDDEKIAGNPTTDGLRRVFEIALNCDIIDSSSNVVQSPSPDNEKRATVVHTISYFLKDESVPEQSKHRSVSGAADVYWGNCDKVFRNHAVAVADTRAEGRALRRALKLRKVVAAEELAKDIEDHPDANSVSKISNNQINFIDVLAKRLNINVVNLLDSLSIQTTNIYDMTHDDGVKSIKELSTLQTNLESIPEKLKGYDAGWK
jgi:hypothetical protein